MIITATADLGLYEVTSTATIQNNALSANTVLSTSYSFTIKVQKECANTVIQEKMIDDITHVVGKTAVAQDISFKDSIATSR